jgi:hypothetical protein
VMLRRWYRHRDDHRAVVEGVRSSSFSL